MFTRRPKGEGVFSDPPPALPEPEEADLVEVLRDACDVAQVLAREPGCSQKIGEWAACVLQAVHDATQAIVEGHVTQEGVYKRSRWPSVEASEDFIRDLAQLARTFTQNEQRQLVRHTKAKPYREALFRYMSEGVQITESLRCAPTPTMCKRTFSPALTRRS